jgi:glycine cleavage system P protein (glycine dehydrogenase) subunit 1
MRFLPLTSNNRKEMLAAAGAASIDDLYKDVPAKVLLQKPVNLPPHKSEPEVEAHFAALAERNVRAGSVPFFVGCGAYRHHVPALVDHLIQRGEFLTSYTPYQPEISQGTLQYLFEFQTQVALLTGMEVANASLYDGSTGTAEAVLMAHRLTKRTKVILSGNLHPHYRDVVTTMTQFGDERIGALAPNPASPAGDLEEMTKRIDADTSCVVVQNPDVFGHVQDLTALAKACHHQGALLVVVVTEAVSMGSLKSPGAMGADIVVGDGQSIGNGLNFGGPYLGLFATRSEFVRQMPGRLCGETVDQDGKRGYVLTLSTREQHIRREKATSNICTNSGLTSLAFCVHMTLLGEKGFRQLALLNHRNAQRLKAAVSGIEGVKVLNRTFFNEIAVALPKDAASTVERLAGKGILAGVPASRLYPGEKALAKVLILAATETVSESDIETLKAGLAEVLE